MIISKDTERVLEVLDTFSNNSLRKRNDLALILEAGATFGEADSVNMLIFAGSSARNLSKTIKRNPDNTEGSPFLIRELMKSIAEIRAALIKISEYFEDEVLDRFQRVYIKENSGSDKNIIDLAHDLSFLKDLQGQIKRKEI